MLGTSPPDTDGNGTPDCLECDDGVKDLAKNCCKEKELVTAYYDEDGDGRYEKKVKVCPKTIEGNSKYIPSTGGENCIGKDKDNDLIPDDCDPCPNFAGPKNCEGKCETEPVCGCNDDNCSFQGITSKVNLVPYTQILSKCTWGDTRLEEINVSASICKKNGAWIIKTALITMDYSTISRLLPSVSEANPNLATSSNFCSMVTDLASLAQLCSVKWYTVNAVKDHEAVHLKDFVTVFNATLFGIKRKLQKTSFHTKDCNDEAKSRSEIENQVATMIKNQIISIYNANYPDSVTHGINGTAVQAEKQATDALIISICNKFPTLKSNCQSCP